MDFTREELTEILSAISVAISEFETRANPLTEWKALEKKIELYLASK